MKFIKSSLFSFILFGLLAFNFFSGCTRGDKLKELHPVESPTILADGVCPESVELTTTYTIMDPVLYPDLCAGWDLVVAVSVTDSPDLPDGCECASNEYCIYLRVPQYTEPGFEVAYSKVNATQSPLLLTIGNPNYYQGYEP
ncbi:MAG TPA: hypothetical protein ENJ82_11725, partial [Bacteroidetes bacterium]|nr:hypothetical protein [Bacteroidota bacterium]